MSQFVREEIKYEEHNGFKRRPKSASSSRSFDTSDGPIPVTNPTEDTSNRKPSKQNGHKRTRLNHGLNTHQSLPALSSSQQSSSGQKLASQTLSNGQTIYPVCMVDRGGGQHTLCRKCRRSKEPDEKTERTEEVSTAVDTGSTETCRRHEGRQIHSFCTDHCCLCCDFCEQSTHRQCKRTSLLSFLEDAKHIKQATDKTVREKLRQMILKRKDLECEMSDLRKTENGLKEHVQTAAEEMIRTIKQLERQLLSQVESSFTEKTTKCSNDIHDCEEFIKKLSGYAQQLEKPKPLNTTLLKRMEMIKGIEKHLYDDMTKIDVVLGKSERAEKCVFEVNELLKKTIYEADHLGNIVFNILTTSSVSSQLLEESSLSSYSEECFTPVSVTKYDFLNTWCHGDAQNDTDISCIRRLRNNDIVLCDIANMKIKWFELIESRLTLKRKQSFDSRPWFLEELSDNRLITTFPDARSFAELLVEAKKNQLKCRTLVNLVDSYPVFCVADDVIVFAKITKRFFLTTNLDGLNPVATFSDTVEAHFSRPNHMLYSKDTNILFVNDPDTGVFGINFLSKEILFHYSPPDLICPLETTLGPSGDLLIIANQSNVIHCISRFDGEYRYHITLETLPDSYSPQCICYLPSTDEYIVSFANCQRIMKFKTNTKANFSS